MRKLIINPVILMTLSLLILPIVILGGRNESGKKIKVFVSIPPLAYFVERIGGDDIDCRVLISPGQSHETFEATPRQLAEFSGADAFFTIGFQFEKLLAQKIAESFEHLKIFNCQRGIELIRLEHPHIHDKANSSEEDNRQDPHIWLDPSRARIMARNISDALAEINPEDGEIYLTNLDLLLADLDSLNADIARQLLPLKGKAFYVFHPAYGYFSEAFGLKQVAVEIDGKEPTAHQLAELITQAKKDNTSILFVQPQSSDKSAGIFAEAIGARLVPIDPLARDYINNLKEIARQLTSALKNHHE